MRCILKLKSQGYLTDEHVKAALSWRSDPYKSLLAPSMFRILHDAISKELGSTEIEERRGLSPKSAKAIIRLLLTSLIECESMFFQTPEDRDDAMKAERDFLTGKNLSEITQIMEKFGFTQSEATIFLVLRNNTGGVLPYETLHNRLYLDHPDPPDPNGLKVHFCRIRQKLENHPWRLTTVYGVGMRLDADV